MRVSVPKFKSEKEEADWLYAHRHEIERDFARSKRSDLTVRQVVERSQHPPLNPHPAR